MPLLSEVQILECLWKACEQAGSQKAWAEKNGVSPSYVTDVLLGRRAPGDAITHRLGFERVVRYRKVGNG